MCDHMVCARSICWKNIGVRSGGVAAGLLERMLVSGRPLIPGVGAVFARRGLRLGFGLVDA